MCQKGGGLKSSERCKCISQIIKTHLIVISQPQDLAIPIQNKLYN